MRGAGHGGSLPGWPVPALELLIDAPGTSAIRPFREAVPA